MRKRHIAGWMGLLSATLMGCSGEPFSSVSMAHGGASVGEMRQEIHTLRLQVDALNEELGTLYNRGEVQEDLLSSLRQDLTTGGSPAKGQENRLAKMEKDLRGLTSDLATLKKHADQTNDALAFQKKKVKDLEDNSDRLLTTMQQMAGVADTSSSPSYTVKSGDTLEKIARRHSTSIADLKKLNHLSNDRIYVGQNLRVQ